MLLIVVESGFALGGFGPLCRIRTYAVLEEFSYRKTDAGDDSFLNLRRHFVRLPSPALTVGECVVAAQRPRVDVAGEREFLPNSFLLFFRTVSRLRCHFRCCIMRMTVSPTDAFVLSVLP